MRGFAFLDTRPLPDFEECFAFLDTRPLTLTNVSHFWTSDP